MKSRGGKNKLKKFLNKFWFIVWKDNSPKGWIISVIFLFIIIKFAFLPGLGLVTGTELPLAIVESCSMYHQGNLFSNFDAWWERHEPKYAKLIINDLDFQDFIFKNGFNKGDILFIVKANPEKLKQGDVIVFNANKEHPLIHRIIEVKKQGDTRIFSTIGDNNNAQLTIEKEISEDQIIGKAVFKLAPYIGWGKLIFYEKLRPESERGFCEEN